MPAIGVLVCSWIETKALVIPDDIAATMPLILKPKDNKKNSVLQEIIRRTISTSIDCPDDLDIVGNDSGLIICWLLIVVMASGMY